MRTIHTGENAPEEAQHLYHMMGLQKVADPLTDLVMSEVKEIVDVVKENVIHRLESRVGKRKELTEQEKVKRAIEAVNKIISCLFEKS